MTDSDWEAAMDVARRFTGFQSYGSEARAVTALRGRRPGLNADSARAAFQAAHDLFTRTSDLVHQQRATLWEEYRNKGSAEFDRLAALLHEQNPAIPLHFCLNAVHWIWYWRHLR